MSDTEIIWSEMEKADLGPAMKALPQMQQRFVWALVMQGGRNASGAARIAGYAPGSENSLRVTGHRLSHDPKVNAAIQEVSRQRLQHHALLGTDVLIQIVEGMHGAKASDRLKAIEIIFGRAGLPQVTEHRITDDRPQDQAALMAELDKKLAQVGMKIAELLPGYEHAGMLPKPVDAEFVEVRGSSTGLEDLL